MNRIKELREKSGMTQIRLSLELGLTQETISSYEKGKHNPSVTTLIQLSEFFKVSTDYLLGLSEIRGSVTTCELSNDEIELVKIFTELEDYKKESVKAYIRGIGAYIDRPIQERGRL